MKVGQRLNAEAIAKAKELEEIMDELSLIERYKKLDASFISKLNKHREKQYFLCASEGFNFITKEYADEQMNIL